MNLLRVYKKWRQLKKIDKWKRGCYHIDFNELDNDDYYNVEVWIKPWVGTVKKGKYKLVKEEVAEDYKGDVVNALFDIFHYWIELLSDYKEPYFLGLFFYEDRVSRSQIILSINEKSEFYKRQFVESNRVKDFSYFSLLERALVKYDCSYYKTNDSTDENVIIVKAPNSIW